MDAPAAIVLVIDESHGIKHSMDVLNYAHNIYKNEINNYPIIKKHERIIYISAIIHDMCDKKYCDCQTHWIDWVFICLLIILPCLFLSPYVMAKITTAIPFCIDFWKIVFGGK